MDEGNESAETKPTVFECISDTSVPSNSTETGVRKAWWIWHIVGYARSDKGYKLVEGNIPRPLSLRDLPINTGVELWNSIIASSVFISSHFW